MSNDTQPEIRFPGFTEDWEQRKLGEVIRFLNGKAYKQQELLDSGKYRVLRVGNFNTNDRWYYSDLELEENKYANKGDLLYLWATSFGPEIWNEETVIYHYHIWKLEFLTNELDKQYLYTWLLTDKEKIKQTTNGTTMVHVTKGIMEQRLFQFPQDVKEQQKIGAFFKQLDDTIALHQRKLDLLKETKKGFLQKMFPKNGAKVPEIRFPGFTEDWEERKVGEIFKVTRGQVLAATETSESITEKNIYPVYSSQTKNDGLMGYYSDYLFDTAITWTTDGANAGTVNYRNGKFYSTNVNGVLLSDKGYANKAVAEIINRIAWKHVSKVGNPKLMNNVMSEITITIPSVEEQETISRFFTQLDSTITLHERELDLLKETKKGFLQKMFV